MALSDLPQEKWSSGTGRQVILKGDFAAIESAILEVFQVLHPPDLVWVSASQVKIPATAECPARLMLAGFPSPWGGGQLVDGGLSDKRYREATSEVVLNLGLAAHRWGTEKPSQWYAVYAIAGNADSSFTLKAMPVMRVAAQAGQTITLRNNANTANIGYGFATDELRNFQILVLSGAARGRRRLVTANNNDDGTNGTLSYGGSTLELAAGDWFVLLPVTNFRYLGMIFNNASGNLEPFWQQGQRWEWRSLRPVTVQPTSGWAVLDLSLLVPPTARSFLGLACAREGYDVKAAFSADGTTVAALVHLQPPATPFQGVRGAIPCRCRVLDGSWIYYSNENTANQVFWAMGWEEG